MTGIFFDIMQGSPLNQEGPQTKVGHRLFVRSPCFFFPTPPGTLMDVNPAYKDVPFIQEKLEVHKRLIGLYRATITLWEAEEPDCPLLPKVKEQLKRVLKTWADITEGQPCQ